MFNGVEWTGFKTEASTKSDGRHDAHNSMCCPSYLLLKGTQ